MGYKYIDHTADLGIEIIGTTLEEVFIHTARAIFNTQINGKILTKEALDFEIKSSSLEELFIDWCRELLFNFSLKGFIPKIYKIKISNENSLIAQLRGDKFDKERHSIKLEIKNPTYHNLSIKKINNQYYATIIFDV